MWKILTYVALQGVYEWMPKKTYLKEGENGNREQINVDLRLSNRKKKHEPSLLHKQIIYTFESHVVFLSLFPVSLFF